MASVIRKTSINLRETEHAAWMALADVLQVPPSRAIGMLLLGDVAVGPLVVPPDPVEEEARREVRRERLRRAHIRRQLARSAGFREELVRFAGECLEATSPNQPGRMRVGDLHGEYLAWREREGLGGPEPTLNRFKEHWEAATGMGWTRRGGQKHYRCRVIPGPVREG